jgi:tetratricopeptide (TPR) repeat protein
MHGKITMSPPTGKARTLPRLLFPLLLAALFVYFPSCGGKKETIAEKRKKSVDVHFFRGFDYAKAGKDEGAKEEFRKALQLQPGHAESHLHLGLVYGREGNTEGEYHEYLEALKSKPDYALAYYNLGILYEEQDMLLLAIQAFELAVEKDPLLTAAYEHLGFLYQETEDYPASMESLEELLRLAPDDALAHNLLGKALEVEGRFEEAAGEKARAARLDDDFAFPEAAPGLKPGDGAPAPQKDPGLIYREFKDRADRFRKDGDMFSSNEKSLFAQLSYSEAILNYEKILFVLPGNEGAEPSPAASGSPADSRDRDIQLLENVRSYISCHRKRLQLDPDYLQTSLEAFKNTANFYRDYESEAVRDSIVQDCVQAAQDLGFRLVRLE